MIDPEHLEQRFEQEQAEMQAIENMLLEQAKELKAIRRLLNEMAEEADDLEPIPSSQEQNEA